MITIKTLTAQKITPETFAPYGQLITPSEDGKPFNTEDAQLDLSQGTPRFYIMRLRDRALGFHEIARHQQCTQCLGSLGGKIWFLAVAPPSEADSLNFETLKVFQIPGDCFIKLHKGTWHAGPHFDGGVVDFYNLELSDTNERDREVYNFKKRDRIAFKIQTASDDSSSSSQS
ncbi:MAG: ureidoglycolate lyase [Jaaginema sp. PMC 1079.18]|nr:ureidoglycolate lyase [Jaaginema sp. PMC 1080.18]MEC4850898.1 ureidoglycolate lyase [Jaaginema sp. PMC 1079.18]MEC4865019.1 ureidoglycolate lyase [Jaaginema sp. PMC 1078.18]